MENKELLLELIKKNFIKPTKQAFLPDKFKYDENSPFKLVSVDFIYKSVKGTFMNFVKFVSQLDNKLYHILRCTYSDNNGNEYYCYRVEIETDLDYNIINITEEIKDDLEFSNFKSMEFMNSLNFNAILFSSYLPRKQYFIRESFKDLMSAKIRKYIGRTYNKFVG